MKKYLSALIVLGFSISTWAQSQILDVVYLTFEGENPSQDVTVSFHSSGLDPAGEVLYDEVSRYGVPVFYDNKAYARTKVVKGTTKTIHHTRLKNLKPNTTYFFVYGSKELGYSLEFKFRTLPDDDRDLVLLNGGDMGTDPIIRNLALPALRNEPDAILIGGDIAYANAKLENVSKWDRWFEVMRHSTITPNGYLVPWILAIGNHEVSTSFSSPIAKSIFFDEYFAQGGKTYFFRKLNKNVGLFVLDSGHRVPFTGKQQRWVERYMKRYRHLKHKIAMYHVPLYPSVRSYLGPPSVSARAHWLRVFDQNRLSVALEHHDHALKRTPLLRNGKPSSRGTLYIGDGCFGKAPRKPKAKSYLAYTAEARHVWSLFVSGDSIHFYANNENGEVIDHIKFYDLNGVRTLSQ